MLNDHSGRNDNTSIGIDDHKKVIEMTKQTVVEMTIHIKVEMTAQIVVEMTT